MSIVKARAGWSAFLFGFVLLAFNPNAHAAPPEWEYVSPPAIRGPIDVLPAEAIEGIETIGTTYKDGETWQALVCSKTCILQPITLRVYSGNIYPDAPEPILGQRLSMSKPLPQRLSVMLKEGRVIALFRLLPDAVIRQPLSTLLHAGMLSYPGAGTPGTLEIGIPPLGPEKYRIVPRLVKDGNANIYLESSSKRQLLGMIHADLGGLEFPEKRKLLLWAGDMDGDHKLDLIMSFPSTLSVVLFLSTFAKDGNAVGEAGSFYLDKSYE